MTLETPAQLAPIVFSDIYLEARKKFLAAAPSAKAYPHRAKGPSGEALFTDAAWFGPADARNVVIMVSATHGQEGYCGSGAQLAFLKTASHERLPPSTAVLLIHALNAYGFAWDRRVTVEGCDLNRNFADFSKPPPVNPDYEALHEHYFPADTSPEAQQRADAAIAEFRALHGEQRFRAARSSGQYTRPGGASYGGSEPTEARRILEHIAKDFEIAARKQIIIVDFHTGLGPYGYGELQCEQPSGLAGYRRAVEIFGPSVTSPELGTSSSIILHGTQDEFWQRLLGDRHTYIAVEFGTYETERVRAFLWKDLLLFLYHPEDADTASGREIRTATKNFFYPQRPDWQEMILWRSHQVLRQAIEALATETSGSARAKE